MAKITFEVPDGELVSQVGDLFNGELLYPKLKPGVGARELATCLAEVMTVLAADSGWLVNFFDEVNDQRPELLDKVVDRV